MAELTVEMTYATALYQAACESGNDKAVMEDATELLQILKDNPELDAFIKSPAVAAEDKKKIFCELFEGKAAQELVNFVCILIDKRRIVALPRMIRAYAKLYSKKSGTVEGIIYTVQPLTEDRLARFEEETSRLLGENVKLENQIDSALIGGVKIMVNGRIIDASIQTRLKRLASEIRL